MCISSYAVFLVNELKAWSLVDIFCFTVSATKAWMPVCEGPAKATPQTASHNSCVGTKLCIMSCDGEAKIGETGPDGCQRCTCIKKG